MLAHVHQYITLRTTQNIYVLVDRELNRPPQTAIEFMRRFDASVAPKSDSVFTRCDVVSRRGNYIEFFPTQRSNYLGFSCFDAEKFI